MLVATYPKEKKREGSSGQRRNLTSSEVASNLISSISGKHGRRTGQAGAVEPQAVESPRLSTRQMFIGPSKLLFVDNRAAGLSNFVPPAAARQRPVQSPSTRSHLLHQSQSQRVQDRSTHTHSNLQSAPARPHSTSFTTPSLNEAGTPTTPLPALNMMLLSARLYTH